MSRILGLGVILAVASMVGAPEIAQGQTEAAKPRSGAARREAERKAQAAFVAGRYQEALDLLEGLYADYRDPVYMRNIGRSYQKLGDPDRAIASFEDYLARAKDVTPAEREEVRGFIREMEELKRKKATPPPAPALPTPTPAPALPAPALPAPGAPAPAPSYAPPLPAPTAVPPAATLAVPAAPPTPTTERSSGGAGKWIGIISLGVALGLAGGGTAMLLSSISEFDRGKAGGCPGAFDCNQIADRVESRALASKILFAAAGVAAVAGGTILVISLVGKSDAQGNAGNEFTVALRRSF